MRTLKRCLALILVMCLSFSPIRAFALEDDGAGIDTVEKLLAAIEAADYGDVITILPGIILENITISTDKDLTILRDMADEKSMTKSLFIMEDSSTIEGLQFSDNAWCMGTINVSGVDTNIINCSFEGVGSDDEEYMNEAIVIRSGASTHIDSCNFSACNGHALMIETDTEVIINDTVFSNNITGSISNGGITTMENCSITGGESIENYGTLKLNDCILNGNCPWARVGADLWNSSKGQIYISHSKINNRVYYDRNSGELLSLPFEASGEITIHSASTTDDVKIYDKDDIRELREFLHLIENSENGDVLTINAPLNIRQCQTDKHLILVRGDKCANSPMFWLYDGCGLSGFEIVDSNSNFPSIYMVGYTPTSSEVTINNCTFTSDTENPDKVFIEISGYNCVINDSKFSTNKDIAINTSRAREGLSITDCIFADSISDNPPKTENDENNDNPPDSTDTDNNTENPDNPPADNSDNSDNPPENPEDTENGNNSDNPADNDNTEESGEPDTTPDEPEQPTQPSTPRDNSTHRPTPTPTQPEETPIEDTPEAQPIEVKPALVCNGAALDTSRKVVLQGYGNGALYENDALTRAQAATIIYRLLDSDSLATLEDVAPIDFLDVDSAAWYAPYVQTISKAGIVTGIGAGHFAPDEALTWAQLITVLTRFVQPQKCTLQYVRYPSWAAEAMQTAAFYGWIADNPYFNANRTVSRGDATLYINYVLELSKLK